MRWPASTNATSVATARASTSPTWSGANITPAGTQNILDAVAARRLRIGCAGLARVLGWLDGEAVQRALTRLLGQQTVRAQVVEALVRNGAGVVDAARSSSCAPRISTRGRRRRWRSAASAIAARPAPLVAALDDRELAVPAAGALARIGDRDGVRRPARPARRHATPRSGRSAIAALNSIGHPDMPQRIARAARRCRPGRARVGGQDRRLLRLSRAAWIGCSRAVATTSRDRAPRRRRATAVLRGRPGLARLLDRRSRTIRRRCVPRPRAALARVEHPGRVDAAASARCTTAIPGSATSRCDRSARSAIRPRCRTSSTGSQDDPAPHVRLAAIDVIGSLEPPDALASLEPLTRSANEDIAARGHRGARRPRAGRGARRCSSSSARAREALAAAGGDRGAGTPAPTPASPSILQWVAAADQRRRRRGRRGRRPGDGRHGAKTNRAATPRGALIALTAEPAARESAIAALSGLPPRRIADVAAGLQHASPDVRCATVEALGRMKRPDASRAARAGAGRSRAAPCGWPPSPN